MSCDAGDYVCIMNNCSGDIGAGNDLILYWNTHDCPAAYAQFINTTGTNLQYNPTALLTAQGRVVELFDTYLSTNTLTDNVTSPTYSSFQTTLERLCIDPRLPGICARFLEGYCSDYTHAEAATSPTLINFCGCYVAPDPDYVKYTLGNGGCLAGADTCQGGCVAGSADCFPLPACDPLCHRALTSQKSNPITGNLITCPQNVCVIDNVTINTLNSTIPGGINFNTLCPGCNNLGKTGTAGCVCIVGGVNINSTVSEVGLGVNFNQFCGSTSTCIQLDAEGNQVSVGPCLDINPADVPIIASSYTSYTIIILVIIGLVAVIAICLAAWNNRPSANKPQYVDARSIGSANIAISENSIGK